MKPEVKTERCQTASDDRFCCLVCQTGRKTLFCSYKKLLKKKKKELQKKVTSKAVVKGGGKVERYAGSSFVSTATLVSSSNSAPSDGGSSKESGKDGACVHLTTHTVTVDLFANRCEKPGVSSLCSEFVHSVVDRFCVNAGAYRHAAANSCFLSTHIVL